MVSLGMKCIKCILFIFNFIFFIAGLVLIIAGTLVQTKYNDDFEFFEGTSVNYVAMLLICVGVIIFIIGFFGCCGAYKESHCMLLTFSVLLGFVFITEIAAAITIHVMRNQLEDLIEKTMNESSNNYHKSTAVTHAWDRIQQDKECCGVNNYTDWRNNTHLKDGSVPDSCCIAYSKDCGGKVIATHNTTNIYTEGCAEKFLKASQITTIIVICCSVGIAILQILGIVFACSLASSVRAGGDYQQM